MEISKHIYRGNVTSEIMFIFYLFNLIIYLINMENLFPKNYASWLFIQKD